MAGTIEQREALLEKVERDLWDIDRHVRFMEREVLSAALKLAEARLRKSELEYQLYTLEKEIEYERHRRPTKEKVPHNK